MNLKFTASIVDQIEQSKKLPIANIIADNSMGNLAFIVSKSIVNDSGNVGITRDKAFEKIDEYIGDGHDSDDLVLDITEALVRDGFLSRTLDVSKMRELKVIRSQEMSQQLDQAIQNLKK